MSLALLGAAAASLLGLGALEQALHRRRLDAIPLRIHVAGTRGKSSVTRLVAGALRRAGKVTAAKTTGTLPRMILPDARELDVFRPRGARITEQARIVARARELGVEALVLECMALRPELHWVSESKLVRATHAIITNVRADHLDVMGPTEADVARCLAGMVPLGGVLATAERRHLGIFERAAADRGTKLLAVSDEELAAVSDVELARFGHVEHRDNVAVALKLLEALDIPRDVALEGMWAAPPDPGALTEHEVSFFGRRIVFVNAFAANDPDSTARLFALAQERHADAERTVAFFNLREDRPERTRQLARHATFWHAAEHVVLLGSGADHFAREALDAGLDATRFAVVEHEALEAVFESIVSLCGRSALVIGMGNIGERGLELVRMFRNRETLAPPAPSEAPQSEARA
ncbi:MAG: poly-gamma-glutamate synthase PgsB [Deltaproteobacteria bacterium]|nr:poly-gamma-glutamate synthase PgsB [Deltaproteobacteria bacterium]